jgi:hypothetical protein
MYSTTMQNLEPKYLSLCLTNTVCENLIEFGGFKFCTKHWCHHKTWRQWTLSAAAYFGSFSSVSSPRRSIWASPSYGNSRCPSHLGTTILHRLLCFGIGSNYDFDLQASPSFLSSRLTHINRCFSVKEHHQAKLAIKVQNRPVGFRCRSLYCERYFSISCVRPFTLLLLLME